MKAEPYFKFCFFMSKAVRCHDYTELPMIDDFDMHVELEFCLVGVFYPMLHFLNDCHNYWYGYFVADL